MKIKLRSYQVLGLTKNFNQYDWEKTRCNNLSGCWGPAERILEVRQKPDIMQMIHIKIRPNQTNEEVVNRLYLSLKKKEYQRERNSNEKIYTSIGSCSKMKDFFWPDLFSGNSSLKKKTYYFHVSIVPRDPVSGLENLPVVWWPDELKTRDRVFPMTMNMEFFESHKDLNLPFPSSYNELVTNYKPSHLTFLDMYEGGAGLRVSQYKWVDNETLNREAPLPLWSNKRSRTDLDVALYENKFRPRWINTQHLDEKNCFVKDFQNGFSGPIVSYWARVHHFNAYFS